MDNLSELQQLWRSVNTDGLPQAAEMVRMVRKYRARRLLPVIGVIVAVLLLLGFLMLKTVDYRVAMWSTRIGAVFMVMAGLILIVAKISTVVRFYRLRDCSNREFVLFLERTRQRQLFYYKRTQVAGLLCCAIGLLLYLYEGVRGSLVVSIVAYAALIGYLTFIWFFVRKRVFKRQERKLQETIDKFEALLKQMEI